jgi:hypothetical protein
MAPREDSHPLAPQWLQLCAAADLDPRRRLESRLAVLQHPQAQDCTLYRPDEDDYEAEEEELGDARVLFVGVFQAPADWEETQREAYFDDCDPALFFSAYVECAASVGTSAFFTAEIGDHVASMTADGQVLMHFVHDFSDSEQGRLCVLLRDDQPLF